MMLLLLLARRDEGSSKEMEKCSPRQGSESSGRVASTKRTERRCCERVAVSLVGKSI